MLETSFVLLFWTLNVLISFRVTGFLASKVGKVAAFALGGGIIILQVAAHQGYININWDKIQTKAEKISDKVEEAVTGEGSNMMDKVLRNCINI